MKKTKNFLIISLMLLFTFSFGVTCYASSLTASISATNNLLRTSTGTFKTSIDYNGFFYTGYYFVEISSNYKVDDVTETSFGASATKFTYVQKGSITKAPVWKFSKSFNSIFSSTKKVEGVLYATIKGTSLPLACGSGSGHDLDDNKTIYRTIK